ncbi:MAG: tetratricopeptide repeat protein, partial [Magnetococcus sp. YQC-3]
LAEPTLPALVKELRRAEKANTPYHVVHFDGHGIYLKDQGLGALCFETVGQENLLFNRATDRVDAKVLMGELAGLRIPLFFLEACQTAQTALDPAASVAAALLELGVAAVAAMSHNVLVTTSRAFVTVFYQELAAGAQVGEAMLEGQRHLFQHKHRGEYIGAGTLDLHDWFVPVLYQEEGDSALVQRGPAKADREFLEKAFLARLGELPEPPPHDFVGRSRELLALERLLLIQTYAVLLGEGGEGKTALGVEAARWLTRIQRVQRVAFVSLEKATHRDAVLDAIGRQVVGKNYSVATFANPDDACLPVERALRAEVTLLLLDNMETVLPPRPGGQPGAYEEETLAALLALFRRLQTVGESKLLFTSRERLPEPFDAERNHLDIGPLAPWDAVEMVKNVLLRANVTPLVEKGVEKETMLLDLVNSAHRHARTLALLAPELARRGVVRTTAELHQLMASLEKKHPNDRERSLYAGVALSLNRLSPEVRQKIQPLGVFQGGGHLGVIGHVLEIADQEQLLPLVAELHQTGLCDLHEDGYLTFHFALAPFLWGELSEADRQSAQQRWLAGEAAFVGFLHEQGFQDAQLSSTLTLRDLDNLLAGLSLAVEQWPTEQALRWASDMASLLRNLEKKLAQQQVVAIQERLVGQLGEGWSHLRFYAAMDHLELMAQQGDLGGAMAAAQTLLQQCLAAGEAAHPEAAYDLAMAYNMAGCYTQRVGHADQAVPLLQEARTRFQRLGGDKQIARQMATAVLGELGECWRVLGKLEEAARCCEQSAQENEQEGNPRGVAISKMQLGMVYIDQRHNEEALEAYREARKIFAKLNDPGSLATVWHQTGMVYAQMHAWAQAEEAYRESLKINTAMGDKGGEANTLNQLGRLFAAQGRQEEAVVHLRKAVDLYALLKDRATEGKGRSNLAVTLVNMGKMEDAQREILQAIEGNKPFGHAAKPWKSYAILAYIETAAGRPEAAAQARREARRLFAQYRRDGGENHNPGAKWCQGVAATIQQGAGQQAREKLEDLANHPQLDSYAKALIPVLLAILSGDRRATLADTPGLDYADAVEVELLLEQLARSAG